MFGSGSNLFLICAAAAVGFVLFTPLAAVLIAAASRGKGRVLAWAFGGSLLAAMACLAVAGGLHFVASRRVTLFFLVLSPWASTLGAVAGWKWAVRKGIAPPAPNGLTGG